jgi:hypothetical protein
MKFSKTTLIVLIFGILSIQVYAQQCAFDPIRQQQLQDPNFAEQERLAEERIQSIIQNRNFSRMNGNVLTVPVVIHVLHLGETEGTGSNISDAQIQSSIDSLNDFYRGETANSPIDFEIEFALAQRDPNCNASTGINRIDASGVQNYTADGISFNGGPGAPQDTLKDLSRWPESDYFNIWIVTEIEGNNGGSGYQGYANFYQGFSYEGSVMMYTVFGYDPTNANPSWPLTFARDNSTVVHEAGHYFHLYHTFQGDDPITNDGVYDDVCPADNTVGEDSDGCADTVPHKRETSSCPSTNTCTSNPWVDNNTINNIMSYYSCTDRLTNDQKARVRAAMEGTSLVESNGVMVADTNFTAPNLACSTNEVETYNAGITSVGINELTYVSSVSAIDGGNIDKSQYCSNYFVIDPTTINLLNVGVSANFNQLGVWIDWNDDGDFMDEAEQQYLVSGGISAYSIVPITLRYPTSIPFDDFVRIRIINDLDSGYTGVNAIDSACYSSIVYGQSEDYVIYVQPSGTTNYVYDNGWLPSNPDGIATASDSIEIMNGDVTISNNTDCNAFMLSANGNLTIESGANLTATSITLNSTSQEFSSLILNGSISGSVTYNRYVAAIAPIATNDLIASPLSGENFADFVSQNSNLASSGTTYLFGPYNTVMGSYENYDSTIDAANNLEPGLGYRAATTDGSNLAFSGTVLSTDVLDIPISDAENGGAWNLIGNPYPSYLDFNVFFTANAAEFDTDSAYQAIYGYDGNASDGWVVWNQATIDEGSITELIAPGQGFFVKSKSGGGLVDFTTSMRSIGNSDDFISGRSSDNNASLCKVNINSSSNDASTQIYFIDGTTRGLDLGYDAGTYSSSSSGFSIYSNLVDDNEGLGMAIQTLPYNDLNDITIPLGINASSGIQLRVSIDDISTLPTHINVYLEDNVEQTLTLLNEMDYTFVSDVELNGTGRFFIRYSSVTLSTEQNDWNDLVIYSTSNPKELIINGQLSSKTEAVLYDIQGRKVLSKNLDEFNTENSIDISRIGTGIYVVKVSNQNQVKTQKLIIK